MKRTFNCIKCGKQLTELEDQICQDCVKINMRPITPRGFANLIDKEITDALIRNEIQVLDEANTSEADRYIVITPTQRNALSNIDKFVSSDLLSEDDSQHTRNFLGQIYGVPVYVKEN